MPTKKYRIWIERRIEHAIEVSGADLTPGQAQDIVYEAQQRGTGCSKHSKTEKESCNSFVKIDNGKFFKIRRHYVHSF